MAEKSINYRVSLFPFLLISALLFSCLGKVEYTYNVPEKTNDGWETAEPGEVDVDSEKINHLIRDILNRKRDILNRKLINIDSVLLVKNEKMILEEYFGEYDRSKLHELHSVSKSITSILIGIAIDKQMIPGVDTKAYTFFPEYKGTHWIDEKYNINLKHILIMSAGIDWDERTKSLNDRDNDIVGLIYSDNWIKYVLNKKVVEPPGLRYNYSGGLNILLGGVIKNTSGLYADRFADKYLFGPLDIDNYAWHRHSDGTINTQGGLSLTPRDMAKIGLLLLNNGKWKGRQIISKEWIDESTKGHIDIGSYDYGYQWYRGGIKANGKDHEAFWAWGRGGQLIFIFPKLDLVAVFTSNPYDNYKGLFRPFRMLKKYILPAMLTK